MKNRTSLCITSFDKDYHLIFSLLDMITNQVDLPDEIIIYISGITHTIDLPNTIVINNISIPIHTIISSKRTIQAVARNICSSVASGDILIFFDVDDVPHPQKIQITRYLFDKYNPDFLIHNYTADNIRQYGNFISIDIDNINIKTNLDLNPDNTNLVCENLPIHHAHIAVKKNVFDRVKFNESMEFYRLEDGKFCQDLLLNKYNGIYCTSPLVRYTVR